MLPSILKSSFWKVRNLLLPGAPDRVIVYGTHSSDWMNALSPGAPVWSRMPCIREVSLRDAGRNRPPRFPFIDSRTVVIPLLEHHIVRCPRNYLSLIPDSTALLHFSDKANFSTYAERHGLSAHCPAHYRRVMDAVFPCVIKRAELNGGVGVALVNSYEELQALFGQEMWNGKKFILQAFVPGTTEYVTHCVCKDGKILWHWSMEYELPSAETMKAAGKHKSTRPCSISARNLAIIEKFLAPIAYSGPCNVDYKLTEEGDILVMEINPRLGGSLMFPLHVDALKEALTCIVENARLPA
ncbi:MAG: hypothetical protein P4L72_14795 [Parvibaculum sp.]|uniref:ATP-binding protein n=1 Tax=Parvibaculum sp. TaxID=2024848 RepID=UPI002845BA03|nr:hypothetical protein [Parvibaculum sp.]MDR3500481.1 hypothetical protein [Parvibaculum sp.]